jgi:hypothetical protein
VVLDHDGGRSEAETIWVFVAGLAGILSLRAYYRPTLGPVEADRALLLGTALGRTTDQVAALCAEPRLAGPDPLARDVRTAARRRMQTSRSKPRLTMPSPSAPEDELDAARALVDVFAGAARHSFSQVNTCGEVMAVLAGIGEDSATLFANLAALERHGRLGELLDLMRGRWDRDLQALRSLPDALIDPQLAQTVGPDLQRVDQFASALMGLLGELAVSSGSADAEQALDEFLSDAASGARTV